MKKIMFNDKYGLTDAVLDGRKTMTRRISKEQIRNSVFWKSGYESIHGYEIKPIYEIGEVVAIAQSYSDCGNMPDFGLDEYGYPIMPKNSGFFNKMFVCANLMPHHIRITDVKVERLQDISDGDCLKEGIYEDSGDDEFPPSIFYDFEGNKDDGFDTPRDAFASLMDKVAGKGTWSSNPYVFCYSFELIEK